MRRHLCLNLCVSLLAMMARDARAGEEQDPWTAADDELGRSGSAAALKLVKDRQGPDIEQLRAYLESGPPVQPELRTAFQKALGLVEARRFDEIVTILAPLQMKDDTLLEARIWGLLAHARGALGAKADRLHALRRWCGVAVRLGWLRGQKEALSRESGILLADLRYGELADVNKRQAEIEERLGDLKAMHSHRLDRAGLLVELGHLREAMEILKTSTEFAASQGWKEIEAAGRDNLALALWRQGEYAPALHEAERAERLWSALGAEGQGNAEGQVNNALIIGEIQLELGDFDAAEAAFENVRQQIREHEGRFDRQFHAAVKGGLGSLAWRRGQHDRALGLLGESRDEFKKIGDQGKYATACEFLGEVLIDAGRADEALRHLDEALKAFGTDPLARAETMAAQADAHLRAGRRDRAAAVVDAALGIEDAEWDRRTRNRLFEIRARVLLANGKTDDAVVSLRKAMDLLEDAVSGLSDEQTFAAREQRARLFQVALESAFRSREPETILEFLERARAAVLREAIGNRGALRRAAVPAELAEELREADQAVVEARVRLHATQGAVEEAKQARGALERAEDRLRHVANGAEREHKRLAGVLQTPPIPLARLQQLLLPGETLVYYALLGGEVVAFVATCDKAPRVVEVGRRADIERAAAALACADPGVAREDSATAARRALIDPLGLPDSTRRLLVSPDGLLAYVPFAALTDREVAYVPSATTCALLRSEEKERGDGVLALGDPDYAAKGDRHAERVLRHGGSLLPLAGTGAEAKAIGDVVLTGRQATETGLRDALAKRVRWRAVHLACHGRVDPERPWRSWLALTPGAGDDGFLTPMDAFRMSIPADLAVLSACETAKGRLYAAEGVVGFVRAFMCAGTPRVIVSLWNVDDDPTRALMEKFYELWKPGKTGTAAALKAAQEHVRSQEKWKDPHYWAAWQLWGLPD